LIYLLFSSVRFFNQLCHIIVRFIMLYLNLWNAVSSGE